nr:1-deoxy-D-xylulose-5-phosphate synthase [Streptomyces tsukubensis NRRL18488]
MTAPPDAWPGPADLAGPSVVRTVPTGDLPIALSYADGPAKARALHGENERAVPAIVGDGTTTGGVAFETLKIVGGALRRPVIVVLNDSGRSYAPTVGALSHHLTAPGRDGRAETSRNLFTALGLARLGPVDGHDTGAIESALRRARTMHRPVVVHVTTVKGKGYAPAEDDEVACLHAVGIVDAATGRPAAHTADVPSWTSLFGEALARTAARREDAVAAAMLRPTGLHLMAEPFPERVFDVGIPEQHAVTSAAGLAMGGCHPVVAICATLLNRSPGILLDLLIVPAGPPAGAALKAAALVECHGFGVTVEDPHGAAGRSGADRPDRPSPCRRHHRGQQPHRRHGLGPRTGMRRRPRPPTGVRARPVPRLRVPRIANRPAGRGGAGCRGYHPRRTARAAAAPAHLRADRPPRLPARRPQ